VAIVPESVVTRFWPKVEVLGDDECWEWKASLGTNGYGQIAFPYPNRPRLAHRVAYAIHHGTDVDEPEAVCHSCDNPKCCNPRHLWAGTRDQNNKDKVAKGRQPRGLVVSERHKARGLLGDRCVATRMFSWQVDAAVEHHENGLSDEDVAFMFGVTPLTVRKRIAEAMR
jgi:hypothetical protein